MFYTIGKLLEFFKFPAIIRPFKYEDGLTGQKITLSTSKYYARLNINGRDYYFDRDSGKFDGTGSCVIKTNLKHMLDA